MQDTHKIIDVHHYIIPREYIESLAKIGINSSLGRNLPHWDVAETLELMNRNGIATSFVSIIPGFQSRYHGTCHTGGALGEYASPGMTERYDAVSYGREPQ